MRAVVILVVLGSAMASDSWFLTAQELDVSRQGSSRSATGIVDVSEGNEIIPLVNGKPFMASLLADINAAGNGDSIYSTMFEVNGDVMLDPTAPDPSSTKLTTVLIAAGKRNASLRILVNDNIYLHSGLAFCHQINSHGCSISTCCAPETRHHAPGGSVHSKAWSFVYHSSEVVSYVGSMDVTGDRWDDQSHDDDTARETEPDDINHFHGWHGDMFRVRGAAAYDVARHFWLQWNDPAPLPDYGLFYKLKPMAWSVPAVGSPGNLTVQLTRTLGCKGAVKDGFYRSVAPKGEYSYAAAFKKMVAKARSYIYMEDQFVFYDDALQAVADALPHVDAVIIVTDNATAFSTHFAGVDVTVASNMRYFHQRRCLDLLTKNASLAHKVHVFELAREGYALTGNFSKTWLYTHSKNYFVDDEFMLVGSHGIERTGWTNDIELSVGVTDGTSGPDSVVGKFRRSLFAEFLQLTVDDPKLATVASAVAEFERQSALGTARVRSYWPLDIGDTKPEDLVYDVYEPDGRC